VAAIVAVVVVRAAARPGGLVRAIGGLVALAAVIGALFLFTSAGSPTPSEPAWLGRPGITAIDTEAGRLYANIPLGSAVGPMPDLAGFLDRERAAWVASVKFVPFAVSTDTIELRMVEGRVVAVIRAPEPEDDWDEAELQGLGGALAHALAYAYPGTFFRDPALPEVNHAAAGPPPGPAGQWVFDVATYGEDVTDQEARSLATRVLGDPRVKEYLRDSTFAPANFPWGVGLEASNGKVRAVLERRVYPSEVMAQSVAGGLGYQVCKEGGKRFGRTSVSDTAPADITDDR
jgi:hypothetical protein